MGEEITVDRKIYGRKSWRLRAYRWKVTKRQTIRARQSRKPWELEASRFSGDRGAQCKSTPRDRHTKDYIKSGYSPSSALPAHETRQISLPHSNWSWELGRKVEMWGSGLWCGVPQVRTEEGHPHWTWGLSESLHAEQRDTTHSCIPSLSSQEAENQLITLGKSWGNSQGNSLVQEKTPTDTDICGSPIQLLYWGLLINEPWLYA